MAMDSSGCLGVGEKKSKRKITFRILSECLGHYLLLPLLSQYLTGPYKTGIFSVIMNVTRLM